MNIYILKRLLILIPTFFGITILVYLISTLAPGSPLEMLLSDTSITASDIEMKKAQLGLDQPAIYQYFNWLKELLTGNFGISYRTNTSVFELILERLGPTLLMTVTATILSLMIAIPLGVMSAYKPYSAWDYVSSGVAFIGSSVPNFFAALIFIYIFSIKFQLLPSSGMYDSSGIKSITSLMSHMILPVLVFSIQQIGVLVRQTRGSVLEVLGEDYIVMARAKGLIEFIVIAKHALRNSLIPIVTVVTSMLPFIIGGAVVTEQVFGWPGIGSLMIQSINARDYPTIMGLTVFVAGVVLIGNVIADLLYAMLDPKIRHSR